MKFLLLIFLALAAFPPVSSAQSSSAAAPKTETATTSKNEAAVAATRETSAQNAPAKTSASTASPAVNADPSGVMFFPNAQVSQSFAKGTVLFNGNPQRNYRVHIFHRDKPGEVEVHTKDTDIFYILEGAATIATGGAMLGGN